MSIFVSYAIIILAALTHASLQLDLGGMLLLYHSTKGKFLTRRSRSLVSFYVLGSLTCIFLFLSFACLILTLLGGGPLPVDVLALLVGLLFAISIIVFFAYYRTRSSTELWLPRSVSRFIVSRADSATSRVEAFSLGLLTVFSEFPFSLCLVLVAADSFASFPLSGTYLSIFLYSFLAVSPLLITRIFLRQGRTLADIQRFRVAHRDFFRILSGSLFAILAAFICVYKIFGVFL